MMMSSSSSSSSGTNSSIRTRSHARDSAAASRIQHQHPKKSSQEVQQQPVKVEVSPSNHGTQPLTTLLLKQQHLDASLLRQLQRQNISRPTPIQAHAIPLLLPPTRGSVMASAQTGSGKSLMFALPLCQAVIEQRCKNNNNNNASAAGAPLALVLNPTRELAVQTAGVLQSLLGTTTTSNHIQVALATGGAAVAPQRRQLLDADILVGTPGRVLQFLDERRLRLDTGGRCQFVVVDEADRLLDLGFEPQLQRIARALSSSPGRRQTVLCSATFPAEVQRLGSLFLPPDYYFVAAGRVGGMHSHIRQKFVWAGQQSNNSSSPHQQQQQQRRARVLQEVRTFLDQQQPRQRSSSSSSSLPRVIVFCNTKDEAERLGAAWKQQQQQSPSSHHHAVAVVTGDKTQSDRHRALQAFRQGRVPLLVASDVAARGLDVPHVGLVVQADAPRDADTFVHRVGRTGRAGATGAATTFLDGRSVGLAVDLVELLHEAGAGGGATVVPAWLRGMAHVGRARRLEEEGAIAAGGGGGRMSSSSSQLNGPSPPSAAVDTTAATEGSTSSLSSSSEGVFSGQDFRSSADPGSWGSERDTAYHGFEEEAYSSLEASDSSFTLEEYASSTEVVVGDRTRSVKVESSMQQQELVMDDDDVEMDQENESPGIPAAEPLPLARPLVSKELKAALRRITGSAELSETPNRDVLHALSKKGADQKLRFEYIGMFPFELIAELLSSRRNRDALTSKSKSLPRVLMVAEKPSIAKAIADALSGPMGPRQRRGISRALPVYEFTSQDFAPATDDPLNSSGGSRVLCTVTSVVGHIFSLGFAEETAPDGSRKRLDPVEYFSVPVVKQEETTTGKLRVIDHLRALAAECDHLVLWLDCDAEGENISYETIGVTRRALEQRVAEEKAANPDGTPVRRIHRAKFSAISRDALRDAFRDLGEPDAALSRSVDARQELDLRVGVAMTRLLTWRCVGLARQRYSPSTKLVSYGPCQSPTLSFCVDRAREIQAFKPKKYWKVKTTARSPDDPKITYELRWKPPDPVESTSKKKAGYRKREDSGVQYEESATFDAKSAADIVRQASRSGSVLRVSRVEAVSERVISPVGLNTVSLLSAGSKSMGLSPKQVMNVAEKLYSAGYLSYPRTETTAYPKDFDVRAMLREHASHPEWGRTASHLLRTRSSRKPANRGKDVGDHPPITCLRAATREEVGGGAAWRVYEFVVRNMLGSFSDDLFFTRTVAQLELLPGESGGSASNGPPPFELEEVTVESLGFAGACTWVLKDIGAQKKDDPGRGGSRALAEGMTLKVSDIRSEVCHTKPPRFLQEHELIELMDSNRIGTDASMATHVNNIVERGYVVLCDETGTELRPPRPPRPGQPRPPRQIGRYLVPTPLGMSFMDLFGNASSSSRDGAHGETPALLARPAIRAQMEDECKQIAMGQLDKETCLKTNLSWFQSRYEELASSLTRDLLLNQFANTLRPLKDGLRYWKQYGVFEPKTIHNNNNRRATTNGQAGGRANGRRNGRSAYSGNNKSIQRKRKKKNQSSNGGKKRRHTDINR